MSDFKSRKSIINWLNQRKVIMYSNYGFNYFYKMKKNILHVYNRGNDTWVPCNYVSLYEFFSNSNNRYKSKISKVY